MQHKKRRSSISVDQLAQMSQREFTALREEMKEGFSETATKEDVDIIRRDMESGFHAVGDTLKTIVTELRQIREDVVDLHDLRARIERVEKKVGLRR